MPLFPEDPSREALSFPPVSVNVPSRLRTGKPAPQRRVWSMALAMPVCPA